MVFSPLLESDSLCALLGTVAGVQLLSRTTLQRSVHMRRSCVEELSVSHLPALPTQNTFPTEPLGKPELTTAHSAPNFTFS